MTASYFNVATWDTGTSYLEFQNMLRAAGKEEPEIKQKEAYGASMTEQTMVRNNIEKAATGKLSYSNDVILLQNIKTIYSGANDVLQEHDFTIYRMGDKADTAIALRNSIFKDTVNLSRKSATQVEKEIYGQDIAVVTTTHKVTGMRFCFASFRSWPFTLYASEVTVPKRNKEEELNIKRANQYMLDVIKSANRSVDCVVLGGNTNTDVHNDKSPGPGIFQLLKQKGFQVLSPKTPTQMVLDQHRDRIVDHFFIKSNVPLWKRICLFIISIFRATNQFFLEPCLATSSELCITEPQFTFNADNSSSHVPVMIRIGMKKEPSLLSKICSKNKRK